jgi:hypothetical protein
MCPVCLVVKNAPWHLRGTTILTTPRNRTTMILGRIIRIFVKSITIICVNKEFLVLYWKSLYLYF